MILEIECLQNILQNFSNEYQKSRKSEKENEKKNLQEQTLLKYSKDSSTKKSYMYTKEVISMNQHYNFY